MMANSRSGWMVHFARAPITWASKIQTVTALSTTEVEYIALSTRLRESIPLMGMLKEAVDQGVKIDNFPPKIHCMVFEDNSDALELARLPKSTSSNEAYQPIVPSFQRVRRTTGNSYSGYSHGGTIGDILMKPLPENSFVRHRQSIMGW